MIGTVKALKQSLSPLTRVEDVETVVVYKICQQKNPNNTTLCFMHLKLLLNH